MDQQQPWDHGLEFIAAARGVSTEGGGGRREGIYLVPTFVVTTSDILARSPTEQVAMTIPPRRAAGEH
jgi:hypothetical protein